MKRNLTKAVALLLCAVMILTFAACSSKQTSETATTAAASAKSAAQSSGSSAAASGSTAASGSSASSSAKKDITIGYIAYSDGLAFSLSITNNMKANAEKRGYQLLKTDSNGDATKALAAVDTFLEQGADVIVDSTWVDAATQSIAKKCKDAGVPFVSIDIPVNKEYADNSYFMGINNYQAGVVTGTAAAQYITANWNNKLDYILVAYTESTGEVLKQRIYGAIDAVRKGGVSIDDSNIIWVNPQSTDATVEAKSLTTDFLTAHPDAKHIAMFCVNDQAAMGMEGGVETSGRMDDCIVCGQGCDEPGIENLRREDRTSWIGSTGYFPETYGDYIFKDIIDVLIQGGKPEANTYVTNVFITKDTIDQYYPK
jgi:ribose transport system substrate-binding protein